MEKDESYYIGVWILFAFACASDLKKKWKSGNCLQSEKSYTYQSTGELKGFNFKKGVLVRAINIP